MRRHLIGLLGAGLLCLLAVPASTAHSADTASSTARGVTSTVLSSGTAHPVLGEVSKVDLSASEMTKLHLWPDASRARAASLPRSSTSTQDGGGAYTALAPSRLLDTRVTGDDLGRGASLNLTVTGGSVPTTATAVALNVTVTDTTASSYLSVYPSGATRPVVSSLNWTRGRTVANLVIVPVGADGQVTFFNDLGSTAVIADLEGYFSPSTGTTAGSYVALTPERIVDTRTGSGLRDAGAELGPHEYLQVPIDGNTELPSSGVEAVLCNITAVDTTPAICTAQSDCRTRTSRARPWQQISDSLHEPPVERSTSRRIILTNVAVRSMLSLDKYPSELGRFSRLGRDDAGYLDKKVQHVLDLLSGQCLQELSPAGRH